MRILVADDESSIRDAIKYDFAERGVDNTIFASHGKEAQELFDTYEPDIVLLDIKMPKLDGMQLLKYMINKAPETKIIMISAHGTIELAVEAMKIGAYDFIVKPFSLDEVYLKVKKLLKYEKGPLLPNVFLGESSEFRYVLEKLKKVARVDSTILITGESGTGKEMAARYIHEKSPRKEESFIPVNCASLSKELLGSELFGHKKGSFTGAVEERKGKFKAAHGGTIFLDEIGEIPLEIQAKLLRVLQEGEIEKIGESSPEKVDTRVIAATNRDLSKMVEDGDFREDLFYRINVIEVNMPPLRNRKDDIKMLSKFFIENIADRIGIHKKNISEKALENLRSYSWPGNIRELRNAIERALVLSEDEELTEKDFNFLSKENVQKGEDKFEQSERNLILSHIDKARNKTELARILGIKRTTLLYKLKKYEIDF